MSVKHKKDSIKELSEKKTPEELAVENEQLKREVTGLQLALCEVYELVEAAAGAGVNK